MIKRIVLHVLVIILCLNIVYSNIIENHTKITDGQNGFIPNTLDNDDRIGNYIVNIGDLDGDGITDLAAAAQRDENLTGVQDLEGAVYILFLNRNGTVDSFTKIVDGQNGFFPSGLEGGDYFGRDIVNIGDLDGDGNTDLAVSAYQDENGDAGEGAVYILFLNPNGSVKNHTKIADGLNGFDSANTDGNDWFGYSMTSIGDLNADGNNDLAVGAQRYGSGGEGAVFILFLETNGSVKNYTRIYGGENGFNPSGYDISDYFGTYVEHIGDLDGDGYADLAVGAINDENVSGIDFSEGAVYIVFLNQNGSVHNHTKITDGQSGFSPDSLENSDYFGDHIENIGDLDGDGNTDLAVGAYRDENGDLEEGAIYVLLLNTNGSVKNYTKISDGLNGFNPSGLGVNDNFGNHILNIGDINQDGTNDLFVGAYIDEIGIASSGAVYFFIMNPNGSVANHSKIGDPSEGFSPDELGADDRFGTFIESIGDLNQDGVTDIIVTAILDENVSGTDNAEGAMYILFLNSTYFPAVFPSPNSTISTSEGGLFPLVNPLLLLLLLLPLFYYHRK